MNSNNKVALVEDPSNLRARNQTPQIGFSKAASKRQNAQHQCPKFTVLSEISNASDSEGDGMMTKTSMFQRLSEDGSDVNDRVNDNDNGFYTPLKSFKAHKKLF